MSENGNEPSPVHRHSWRQKGIAVAVAGALAIPFIDGYLDERTAPAPRNDTRALHAPSPHVRIRDGLESIIDTPPRDTPLAPRFGLNIADASLALDEAIIADYERGTEMLDSQAEFITAISYIESLGGQLHVPWAYIDRVEGGQQATSAPQDVPFGDHHVKREDLEGVLGQAAEARRFYSRFGDDVVERIEGLGWHASDEVASVLDAKQMDTALEYFHGESGMRRMAGLLATVPEGIEVGDLRDPKQSALAAAIMDAYTVHRLVSNDIEVDERLRLLIYTAGPNNVLAELPEDHTSLSDEEFTEFARSVSGDWGAWYVQAGQQVLGALREYGFEHLDATADAFDTYRDLPSSSGLRNETLGALYLGELEHPGYLEAFERFRASVPSLEDPNRAYETFVSIGSPDSTYAER